MITWFALAACGGRVEETRHLVRGGVVTTGPAGARFEARDWRPGEPIDGEPAPRIAECVRLFSVSLGDPTRLVAAGAEAPDTALAFSPDDRWLAVGTLLGDVLVLDAATGAVRARRTFPEAMAKRLSWAPDGSALWMGEQSPDAMVYRLDPSDLHELARFRAADALGGGQAPAGDDLYARYALPGIYGLVAEPDGAWVVGAHGWTDASGTRINRSRVWRLGVDASVRGAWPENAAADAIFGGLAVGGGRAVVSVRRSADGPPPADVPIDALGILNGTPALSAAARIAPLAPWYDGVFVGDGLTVVGDAVWAGLGDGRVVSAALSDGAIRSVSAIGTPRAGDAVPLAATVGWVAPSGGRVIAVTTRAVIPYGTASPALRPTTLHPAEDTVLALDAAGAEVWRWHGPQALQGLVADDRWIVVGAGERTSDVRRDLFGAVVLDAASGALAATCPTESPVFFRPALARDGRIALAEVPYRAPGGVEGAYRVTVLR